MFDFLFKRASGKTVAAPLAATSKAKLPTGNQTPGESTNAELKAELISHTAHMARLRAEALLALAREKNDSAGEEALAAFILECEFADARLVAAEGIQTRPWLTQVYQATRNLDRRVAKLMHGRLDLLVRQEAQQKQMEQCIEQARQLAQQAALAVNQVAELDRAWRAIPAAEASAHGPLALTRQFEALQATLAERLQAQAALQRAMLDDVAALRLLANGDTAEAEPAGLDARLAPFAQRIEQYANAAEAASLPRHLAAQLATEYAQAAARVAQRVQQDQAWAARRDALAGWQAEGAGQLDAGRLRQAWQALPAPDGERGSEQQAQFEALLQQVRAAHPPAPASAARAKVAAPADERPVPAPSGARPPKDGGAQPGSDKTPRMGSAEIDAALAAMEAALEQGSLHLAQQQDKLLRENLPKRLSETHANRLGHLRAELARLTGWAKWGGNVSREELIKTVQELPAQALAVTELAKKVGSARDAWKVFDTQSGPAPKALWERFDAACTTAYAPAAAHFRQLAEERHQNVDKARALIEELEQFGARVFAPDAASVDWKAVALFCQQQQTAWRQHGPIDRKEKKALDARFDAALQLLRTPLKLQYELETAQRDEWIAQIAALDSSERGALDTLKRLQLQWQERARAVPLPRGVEQALWQRFRAACDTVFAERKQSHHAADAERHQHLQARQAFCAELEQGAGLDEAAIAALLRRDQAEWPAFGEVPRAQADQIRLRHAAALAALEQRKSHLRRDAGAARANARRDRLHLCQALERMLAGGDAAPDPDDWRARWQALPALNGALERAMTARFEQALAAAQDADARARHAALLAQNGAVLLDALLRLEIGAGLASPAEFSAARLKMQVEVLQQSFKSGAAGQSPAEQLARLCALPALADEAAAARLDALFAAVAA